MLIRSPGSLIAAQIPPSQKAGSCGRNVIAVRVNCNGPNQDLASPFGTEMIGRFEYGHSIILIEFGKQLVRELEPFKSAGAQFTMIVSAPAHGCPAHTLMGGDAVFRNVAHYQYGNTSTTKLMDGSKEALT